MDPLELAITTAATGYGVEEVCPPTPSVAEIIVGPTLALASVSTLSNRRVGCIQVQLVLLDRFITRVKTLIKARILQHRKCINRFFTAVILHCKYVVHLHRFFTSVVVHRKFVVYQFVTSVIPHSKCLDIVDYVDSLNVVAFL